MERYRRVAGAGMVAVLLLCGRVGAAWQRTQPSPVPNPAPTVNHDYSGNQTRPWSLEDQTMRELEEKRGKVVNSERQRLMVKEATQLVQVAAELEAGETSGMAREEQIKRAEMIEKLAKSVKERMKGSR